ncbi:hypothetical protein TNCV_1343291 [Trichonephila clavipes]|nr:hypothetical protein TNCV_1343291 [Trichonephila clavipes]
MNAILIHIIQTGRCAKSKCLQEVYRQFAWKFVFLSPQPGHKQADEPLSVYVIVRIMASGEPVQRLLLCSDLSLPS